MLERLVKKTTLTDVFIIIIGALAIVGIWRGSWNLMDEFLFPEYFVLSQIASISAGVLILVIISKIK